MPRGLLVSLVALAACASPRAAAPSFVPAPAPAKPEFFAWGSFPGCSRERAEEDRSRTATLAKMLAGISAPAPETLAPALADIDATWASPCFAHVARLFPRPRITSIEDLRSTWFRGRLSGIGAMLGGLYERDGKRFFYVPPATREPLDAETRRALAPWICEGANADCGNTGSYVSAAEASFDREEERSRQRVESGKYDPCKDAAANEDRDPKPTAFESFALCVASEAPRTYRYPEEVRLRAPQRGWLIVRGRRGHYVFADEIAAYDLATGAAYEARSRSALVLDGPCIDAEAIDEKRELETFTGNVLATAARELAFVVLTAAALRPARTTMTLMPVPADLPLTLSPRLEHAPRASGWGTSEQTTISLTLVDGGTIVAEGSFTYPYSSEPADARANEVLRILEAGREPGCARASLPATLPRSGASGASVLDADPGRQVDVSRKLEDTLLALRRKDCAR
ncbi:MAG: hypothetical protein KIT84_44285 [Labilithrix sp.]|nr:hypothetical protein [Labilithrix sp.]MCW5818098.1 hypothetical protein [Labilithrix sp.]